MKTYPDGTPISVNLPKSYKPSSTKDVPSGQSCGNCKYYVRSHCTKWLSPVRPDYWCSFWENNNKKESL